MSVLQTAVLAGPTRQKYIRVVADDLTSGAALTDQVALATYAATLSKSRRGHLKSAVKKWTEVMATAVKSQATPENIATIQATLLRFEALPDAIQVTSPNGQKARTWLSAHEVRQLLAQPNTRTPSDRRDKIALGLCVAAGLRREETVAVTFADMVQLPQAGSYRAVINCGAKGLKTGLCRSSRRWRRTSPPGARRLAQRGRCCTR
ncbi:MAG TPA: hypothetical protein PLD25_19500 [Chloroflexota bacterium]|nr:hypothetical protein [Chloroflexota bacterium]